MVQQFLRILLCGCLVFAIQTTRAQTAGWLVGGQFGLTLPKSDLGERSYSHWQSQEPYYELRIGHQFAYWQLSLEGHYTVLTDQDRYSRADYFQQRKFQFNTPTYGLSAQVRYMPLPGYRLRPFVYAGVGHLWFDPEVQLDENLLPELQLPIRMDRGYPYDLHAWMIPIGVGTSVQLGERLQAEMSFQVVLTDTDYLDGVSQAGNPDDRDGYGNLLIGMAYNLQRLDRDQDGIVDREDQCPDLAGGYGFKGCPDSDADGVEDRLDDCPLVVGLPQFGGCPDYDNDGIPDPDDECPHVAGLADRAGCPPGDSDNDGLDDSQDNCPEVPGPVSRLGCPPIDTDEDGLLDEDDLCPTEYGPFLFQGCPDTDGDGIPDIEDACPERFGLFTEQGCPVVQGPRKQAELLQQQFITFAPNSSELRQFDLLESVERFLRKHPSYQVLIRGHADPQASENDQRDWATLRAKAVYAYLIDRGVAKNRLRFEGLGNKFPLSPANSDTQRTKNRRVEFQLYLAGE